MSIPCAFNKDDFFTLFSPSGNIVFHGTCDYYSKSIEESGFIIGKTILTQEHIDALIYALEGNDDFIALNETMDYGFMKEKISESIKYTFESVKDNDYTFTMTPDFDCALDFLSDEQKCGQYLKNVKRVASGIKKLNLRECPVKISEIVEIMDDVEKSKGVIYAIDIDSLQTDVDGLRIQVKENIAKERIIAKYINA